MNGAMQRTASMVDSYSSADLNFKSYIQAKMKAVYGKKGSRTVTAAELADSLGMSTKVFQEILNGRRSEPDRRDFVIALCAELGLDAEETDEALSLFPAQLRRLSSDDARDSRIIRFLNADFDVDISCDALNRQLSEGNLPPLKIRHRSQNASEGRTIMEERTINWGQKSEEERQRYNYYTSLNFDDTVATVLALFTYGRKRIPGFSMRDACQALLNGEEYPPPPPPPEPSTFLYDADIDEDALANLGGNLPASAPAASNPPGRPLGRQRIGRSKYLRDFLDDGMPEYRYCVASPSIAAGAGTAAAEKLQIRGLHLADMNTDEYQPIEEKDFRTTMRELTSTFRMTTNTASVGILMNQLRSHRSIDRSMVRIEELLNYFRYQADKPRDEMFRISSEVRNRDNGNKLLYIHVQGREEVKEKQNIVVLLDVSGSMSGNAVHTQEAVATVISKLKPGDTFSLVTYSSRDEVVIDGAEVRSEADLTAFLEKLLGLKIDGGTYGSAGIEKAYEIGRQHYIPDGNNQVILITDGDLNFGITDQGGLERLIEEKKKDHLFLSVIGTGLYNYKDNKLETLAKHGNGVYRVVNKLDEVRKAIRDDYASLVNIIAKDVKAQVEFNPEAVKSFRLLGFENRELKHEEFTDDTVISEPFGSGGYGVALYELVMQPERSTQQVENRYTRVVTTGSSELCTVKVRYKEPLEEVSHELEHVITDASEHYTDNLLLANAVYVGAEKLRDSDKVDAVDEALALADLDRLGTALKVMNVDELPKLREILKRSKERLGVTVTRNTEFDW